MMARLASLAPNIRFAAAWHVLWGALLIPYALIVVLIVGGLDPMQDLVDELAMSFLIVPLVLIIALPLNVGLAVVVRLLLRGVSSWWVGALVSAAFFGALWLLLATIFDLPAAFGASVEPAPFGLWAAGGGAAYGFVVALGFEPSGVRLSSPS